MKAPAPLPPVLADTELTPPDSTSELVPVKKFEITSVCAELPRMLEMNTYALSAAPPENVSGPVPAAKILSPLPPASELPAGVPIAAQYVFSVLLPLAFRVSLPTPATNNRLPVEPV